MLHALQLIGEAVAHISDAAKVELADVPWHQIRAMRNRLTHEYFAIDLVIVWETATRDMPGLITALAPYVLVSDEPLLGDLGGEDA